MALPEFDAEHLVLLACALAPPGIDISAALAPAAREIQHWDRLAASAALNQLRPQLSAIMPSLAARTSEALPVCASLEAVARVHQGHGLLMTAELIRALEALRAANILAVPFKGPAFATLVGSGAQSRETADLDLLIHRSDIARAVETLAQLGYEPLLPTQALRSSWLPLATNELGLLRRADSMLLELHWRLAPRWYPVPIEPEEVLRFVTERCFFGTRILWPCADELLLIHVADGMKSGGCGIRWLGDVASILRGSDFDWRHVREVAQRNGGLNNVRISLAVAEDISDETAAALKLPALALRLPGAARALAEEARRRKRLCAAVRAIRERLSSDARLATASAHFRWALQVADHPVRAAGQIIRYLAGPAVADLECIPAGGLSDFELSFRALCRRLVARGRGAR